MFNGPRLDLLEDVLHPEFRGRGISASVSGGPEVGRGARRKLYEMFLRAIPDCEARCSTFSRKATRSSSCGTQRGEFLARPGGDRIEWKAIHIYTIRGGKVLEDAIMTDTLAVTRHLGLAPSA